MHLETANLTHSNHWNRNKLKPEISFICCMVCLLKTRGCKTWTLPPKNKTMMPFIYNIYKCVKSTDNEMNNNQNTLKHPRSELTRIPAHRTPDSFPSQADPETVFLKKEIYQSASVKPFPWSRGTDSRWYLTQKWVRLYETYRSG